MKRQYLILLFISLALLEVAMISNLRGLIGPYLSPVLLLVVSISIACVYLRLKLKYPIDFQLIPKQRESKHIWTLGSWIIFASMTIYMFVQLHKTFAGITLAEGDSSQSDIIPQIMTLTRRFMRGEMPYAPIPFSTYELYPTYLPLQWLPYCVAEIFHKDYRWIPAIILWLSCLFHLIIAKPWKDGNLIKLLAAIWPLAIWAWLLEEDNYNFAIGVESLIAGYYLFLANGTTRRLPWLLAAGVCLTLFSRYSIIFWIPIAVIAVWKERGWRPVVQVGICVILTFFFIYWLPFLRLDSNIFLKGYHHHSIAAYGEWIHTEGSIVPVHLYNGLGFASWAYHLIPGSVQQRLSIFQNIHLLVCILSVTGLSWWYIKHRKTVSLDIFLLMSLKIYIIIFYSFIQLPYKYLFFTPVIITAVLLRSYFNDEKSGLIRVSTGTRYDPLSPTL